MAGESRPLGLLEGFGVELEYMIVDAETLDVAPIADRLIELESGTIENEIERGEFAWSNELARHVIEVKTNGPVSELDGLAEGFQNELARMNEQVAGLGARLLPTAMHPWMDADREFAIWPHGSREIYETFDRIFDCRGHGWANLQSAHLNLSFANDAEFARLHAASRALLPLLPALAASSPFLEGHSTGLLDTRLDVYRSNARRVPSVSGAVIPEPVFDRAGYEALLETIYTDLAPHDPQGVLRHEWVNARGCIARFDRMALEIRVLDVQECPAADLAIAAAVSGCIRALCETSPAQQKQLRALETGRLAALLARTVEQADAAVIDDSALLDALGLTPGVRTAGDLWLELIDAAGPNVSNAPAVRSALEVIQREGPVSRRILRRLTRLQSDSNTPTSAALRTIYRELADCLREGRMLRVAV